jgi:Arc/MetJ-type ribon-helix-helix transcriptional regulator
MTPFDTGKGEFHTGSMALILTPEQEALVKRSVREGRYASVDAALHAAVSSLVREGSLQKEESYRRTADRSKSLFELMQESPLYGSEIEFDRDRSALRDLDL